jgi:hypothetical protein
MGEDPPEAPAVESEPLRPVLAHPDPVAPAAALERERARAGVAGDARAQPGDQRDDEHSLHDA